MEAPVTPVPDPEATTAPAGPERLWNPSFVLLWLVVFSTLVKVAIQIELARWTIVTGEPACRASASAIMQSCVSTTPFGRPVVPEV